MDAQTYWALLFTIFEFLYVCVDQCLYTDLNVYIKSVLNIKKSWLIRTLRFNYSIHMNYFYDLYERQNFSVDFQRRDRNL